MATAITILHVSDFHFGSEEDYGRHVVLEALLAAVSSLRAKGMTFDLVAATGDIANRGSAEEYAVASRYLNRLLTALELTRKGLLVVPGNHDVDRQASRGLQRTLRSEEDSVGYFAPGAPRYHNAKLRNFRQWFDDYFAGLRRFSTDSTCTFEHLDTGGIGIGVLLVNTALFSADDSDHGNLWIGRRCIDEALKGLEEAAPAVRIALAHHPPDWLHDAERSSIRARLGRCVDVLFQGHLHETLTESIAGPTSELLQVAAGACYQTRQYPNCANVVRLYPLEGKVVVIPLRYEDTPREVWTIDPSLFPDSPNYEGRFDLTFKQPVQPARGEAAPAGRIADSRGALRVPKFHYGSVVPPEFFIDRRTELHEAERILCSGQSVLLSGDRRTGKTSFCHKLIHQIMARQGNRLLASYLNLQVNPDVSIETFLEHTLLNIIGEIARQVFGCKYSDLMKSTAKSSPDIDPGFESLKDIFHVVRTMIRRADDGSKKSSLIPQEFAQLTQDLLQIIREKGWVSYMIFFDEANRLPGKLSIDLLVSNEEALNSAGVACLYAASPQHAESYTPLHESFNHRIHLGPFSDKTHLDSLLVRYYFDQRSGGKDLPVRPEAMSSMWDITSGKPYLIQLLAGRSFTIACSSGSSRVDAEHVRQAHRELQSEYPLEFGPRDRD